MRKIISILIIIFFLLTGCSGEKADMNQLSGDGNYHYENANLGFTLKLPPEFIYYQTQRKQTGEIIDLEIFVPTSDRIYAQEVAGYGKPVTIGIYDKNIWDKMADDDENKKLFIKVGAKNNKIYTMKFWQKIPEDWREKWTEEMKNDILSGIKLN